MTVPSFRIGRAILLERAGRAPRPSVSTPIASLAEPRPAPAVLEPLASPIVKLGSIEVGSHGQFALPLRNRSPRTVTVGARLLVPAVGHAVEIETTTCTLPAGGDGTLTGRFRAGTTPARFVTRMAVGVLGEEEETGFEAFLDGETCVALGIEPSLVDFGTFSGDPGRRLRPVEITTGAERFHIKRFDVESRIPIALEVVDPRGRFRFAPAAVPYGTLNGEAKVRVELEGEEHPRTLAIPFTGRHVPEVWANPAEFVLPPTTSSRRRDVRVAHVDRLPFAIEGVKCDAPWVRTSAPAPGTRPEHMLKVEFLALDGEGKTSLQIACRGPGEARTTLEVPVRSVGRPPRVGAVLVMSDPPAKPAGPPASPAGRDEVSALAEKAKETVEALRFKGLSEKMGNWLILHALLSFEETAYDDAHRSPQMKAMFDWLLRASPDVAEPPFTLRGGKPYPRHTGDRFSQEHHRDQYLAKFALCGVPLEAPLVVSGRTFTVKDILDRSLLDVSRDGELSWTVSAYSHYLPPGHAWKNKFGETLSLAVLVEAMFAEKDLPCGGSHHLFGMARVLSRPELRRDPALAKLVPRLRSRLDEEYLRLKGGQRPDGSFALPSPLRERFAAAPPATPHVAGVYYTGHTLEWLAVGLSPQQLREAWILSTVDYLLKGLDSDFRYRVNTGLRNEEERYAYGYLTHALSGLHRWRSKVLGAGEGGSQSRRR